MKIWLKRIGWSLFSLLTFIGLFWVNAAQEKATLTKPEIFIHASGENTFLTENELFTRLKRAGFLFDNQQQSELKVAAIEQFIKKMTEVKNVSVYTKIGSQWKIDVSLRRPIARIYNRYNETYYLDENGFVLNPSTSHTARVIVVTGNIPDRKNEGSIGQFINNESLKSIRKLDDVYRISNYVCNDPLMQSLIGQIHLKKSGDFVLIPLVGGQKIIFGPADNDKEVAEKFYRLKVFYKEAIPYEGWNKYDEINLKYKKQIVCKNTAVN